MFLSGSSICYLNPAFDLVLPELEEKQTSCMLNRNQQCKKETMDMYIPTSRQAATAQVNVKFQ